MTDGERDQTFLQWQGEHRGILLKVARSFAVSRGDQEDLVQEILIRLWQSMDRFEGMAKPFALHGVQHIFHPPTPLPHWPEGDSVSRIVIIGRDLPPGYLAESLAFLNSKPEMTEHRL